jgi:acetamidase/formamidase
MGLDPNLEEAMKIAVRETIAFITGRFPKLSREEAYMIASVAVDYHVTQAVDGTKGIHGMRSRSLLPNDRVTVRNVACAHLGHLGGLSGVCAAADRASTLSR